jgi:putative ABC transport system permease protein
MGMTRGNILAIFAGETAVTFLLSLGTGILLGMAFYQGLMAIFINYLEIEFTLGGYSWQGFLLTIVLTCGVFLLSSLFSLAYLRVVKISKLLHADKIVEKGTKIPYVWAALLVVSLGLLIYSGIRVYNVFLKDDLYKYVSEMAWSIGLFAFSMVVLHISIAKCIVPLLLKIKDLTSRGTSIFTLRQLSGRLNGNAVLAGVLALILSLCLIGTDVLMMQSSFSEAELNEAYPYDISCEYGGGYSPEPMPFEQAKSIIEKYAEIDDYLKFTVYSFRIQGEDGYYLNNFIIVESDYKALCAMRGITPLSLGDGFVLVWCSRNSYERRNDPNGDKTLIDSDTVISVADKNSVQNYTCTAETFANGLIFSGRNVVTNFAVLPDEAVQHLSYKMTVLEMNLKNPRYSARELEAELSEGISENTVCPYTLKEYVRLDNLGSVGLFLLGEMYVSVVFLLLSMAILALKMLSQLSEDRERYRTLWRLGVDKGMIGRSLFAQMFFYFFLPLIVPLFCSIPVGCYIAASAKIEKVAITTATIFSRVAGVAIALLLLYALYFTVTYMIARRDVNASLRAAA